MKSKIKLVSDILGLDLGLKRTGVARINLIAKIAEPGDFRAGLIAKGKAQVAGFGFEAFKARFGKLLGL